MKKTVSKKIKAKIIDLDKQRANLNYQIDKKDPLGLVQLDDEQFAEVVVKISNSHQNFCGFQTRWAETYDELIKQGIIEKIEQQ